VTLGNNNGTDGQTDGQTDRRTDRVRRNMRPPPREEGRIINIKKVIALNADHKTVYIIRPKQNAVNVYTVKTESGLGYKSSEVRVQVQVQVQVQQKWT